MFKHVATIGVTMFLLGGVTDLIAQKATEIFIPVGMSPGVSGKYSIVGKIDAIKSEGRTITVSSSTGTHEISMISETKIWLDRSKLKQKNQKGNFDDLKKGLAVEIKFKNEQHTGEVEWVKIQLTSG